MNIITPPINFYYLGSVVLIMIGFYMIIECPNLIKKVMGVNIMETAVFLFLIAIGGAQGNKAPIVSDAKNVMYVNPFPHFMVIMGIMITLGVTTFALGLIIRIYQQHNTIDARKLKKLIGQHNGEET